MAVATRGEHFYSFCAYLMLSLTFSCSDLGDRFSAALARLKC